MKHLFSKSLWLGIFDIIRYGGPTHMDCAEGKFFVSMQPDNEEEDIIELECGCSFYDRKQGMTFYLRPKQNDI